MKRRELIAVIIVLCGLNVWLLINMYSQKKELKELSRNETGRILWKYETLDSNPYYVSHDQIEPKKEQLNLIVLFSDQGCQSCVEDEVKLLNALYQEADFPFSVYLLSAHTET